MKHFCALKTKEETGITKLSPNPSFWLRLRRCLRSLTIPSSRNPKTFLYLHSIKAYKDERKRHLATYWYIIHPLSTFVKYWQTIMCLTWFFMLPFEIARPAFERQQIDEKENAVTRSFVFKVCYVICMFDVIRNFMTGYTVFETKEIILKPRQIAIKYLKTFFVIDLLSYLFMLDYIPIKPVNDVQLMIILSLKACRACRLFTAFEYLRNITDCLHISRIWYHNLCLLILCGFLIHTGACIMVYVSESVKYIKGGRVDINSWIEKLKARYSRDMVPFSNMKLYAHGLMETFYKFNLVSFGKITPETVEDIWVTVFIMLVGVGFNSYVILYLMDWLNLVYKASTKYEATQTEILNFCWHQRITDHIKDDILHSFEHIYKKEFYEGNIIQKFISEPLQVELFWDNSKGLLQSSSLFQGISSATAKPIIECLKLQIYLPNEVIEDGKTEKRCMYFINSGTVAVSTLDRKELCHLHDGDQFGLYAVLEESKTMPILVVAIEICEIYVMGKEDFDKYIGTDSDFYLRLIQSERRKTFYQIEELKEKVESTYKKIEENDIKKKKKLNKSKTQYNTM